jgi:demethylmenaquinone methyltransferase/2-methoxy-6-polyprenyl-1,4-benzoquinol methylase
MTKQSSLTQAKPSKIYKTGVIQSFIRLAKTYEMANHVMSFWTDEIARYKTARLVQEKKPRAILDIGIGPGTLARKFLKYHKPTILVGVDITIEMLKKASKESEIQGIIGDAEKLPLRKGSVDLISSGFFLRHYTNYLRGYRERARVLRKGGISIDLELGKHDRHFLFPLHKWYFTRAMHIFGSVVGIPLGSGKEFKLLPLSYTRSPSSSQLEQILNRVGFNASTRDFFLGFYMIIIGRKR